MHGENHNGNTNYCIIPFVIKTRNDCKGSGEDRWWGEEEVSTALKEILRLLETPKCFFLQNK